MKNKCLFYGNMRGKWKNLLKRIVEIVLGYHYEFVKRECPFIPLVALMYLTYKKKLLFVCPAKLGCAYG